VFTQLLREMSTRSRKILFLGSRGRSVRKADNITSICEPTVQTIWDLLNVNALYPRPVTGIAFTLWPTLSQRPGKRELRVLTN
jgi:hypothetical protein